MDKRENAFSDTGPMADDFRRELLKQFDHAERLQFPLIDITAGQLHRAVGDYPRYLTLCCEVMRSEMSLGDRILNEPRRGLAASLTMRYMLPRQKQ